MTDKLSLREATYLRKVYELATQVRYEGNQLSARFRSNAEDYIQSPTVPDTRAYVGATRALREVLELASVMPDSERLEPWWVDLVDRATSEDDGNWIFGMMKK